jgi:hypothetical protein
MPRIWKYVGKPVENGMPKICAASAETQIPGRLPFPTRIMSRQRVGTIPVSGRAHAKEPRDLFDGRTDVVELAPGAHRAVRASRRCQLIVLRLIVLRGDRVVAVQQIAERHLKGHGDPRDMKDRDVTKTALDAGHVGAIDVRQIGERLLRESLLPAELADGRPELPEERI